MWTQTRVSGRGRRRRRVLELDSVVLHLSVCGMERKRNILGGSGAGKLNAHCGADHPGYIDLSKRRVSAEEVIKCEEQFEKGKSVDSILTQVAKKGGVSPESLYEKIAWPLHKQYGHSYEAFKLSIS